MTEFNHPILNEQNFVRYAMKHYDNPQCEGVDEFQEDLNRFKYLKRLLTVYYNNDELKERLILNHIIVLYNIFGVIPATRMLFYKIPEKFHCALKTFLVFLNVLPKQEELRMQTNVERIPLDINIIKKLREI